jgi:hypothetical protein
MVTSLVPDGSRSLAIVGDVHIGSIAPRRTTKFRDAWNRASTGLPAVACLAFVGDLCEGQQSATGKGSVVPTIAGQEAIAQPWIASFTRADHVKVTMGNHDEDRDDSGGPNDGTAVTQWEGVWGQGGGYVDTPYFRLVLSRYGHSSQPYGFNSAHVPAGVTTAQIQADVEDAIAAVPSKPCVLMHHWPAPYGNAGNNGLGKHPAGSEQVTPTMSTTSVNFVHALAARRSNLVAEVGGHNHPFYDTTGMFNTYSLSNGRKLAKINTGALTYVGGGNNPQGNQPLTIPVLTFYTDRMEIRWRDVGSGSWLARNRQSRVEEFLYAS